MYAAGRFRKPTSASSFKLTGTRSVKKPAANDSRKNVPPSDAPIAGLKRSEAAVPRASPMLSGHVTDRSADAGTRTPLCRTTNANAAGRTTAVARTPACAGMVTTTRKITTARTRAEPSTRKTSEPVRTPLARHQTKSSGITHAQTKMSPTSTHARPPPSIRQPLLRSVKTHSAHVRQTKDSTRHE